MSVDRVSRFTGPPLPRLPRSPDGPGPPSGTPTGGLGQDSPVPPVRHRCARPQCGASARPPRPWSRIGSTVQRSRGRRPRPCQPPPHTEEHRLPAARHEVEGDLAGNAAEHASHPVPGILRVAQQGQLRQARQRGAADDDQRALAPGRGSDSRALRRAVPAGDHVVVVVPRLRRPVRLVHRQDRRRRRQLRATHQTPRPRAHPEHGKDRPSSARDAPRGPDQVRAVLRGFLRYRAPRPTRRPGRGCPRGRCGRRGSRRHRTAPAAAPAPPTGHLDRSRARCPSP